MSPATKRVLKHEAQLVPISSLKPYPGNARIHDLPMIRESLRINSQYRPVVVRTKTRHVLAGNGTLEAAVAEGWTEIWATFIDCDARAAERINLVDNGANDAASWDDAALLAQLQSVPDLDGTGFSDDSLAKLLARVEHVEFDATEAEIPEAYEVIVTCKSEREQVTLLERLTAEGMECRALLS